MEMLVRHSAADGPKNLFHFKEFERCTTDLCQRITLMSTEAFNLNTKMLLSSSTAVIFSRSDRKPVKSSLTFQVFMFYDVTRLHRISFTEAFYSVLLSSLQTVGRVVTQPKLGL